VDVGNAADAVVIAGDWCMVEVGVADWPTNSCSELGDGRVGKLEVFTRSELGSADVMISEDWRGTEAAEGKGEDSLATIDVTAATSSADRSPMLASSNCIRTSTSINANSSDIRAARVSCGDNTTGCGGGRGTV